MRDASKTSTGFCRAALAPFESLGLWTGNAPDSANSSIMFAKQDLPFAEALDSSSSVLTSANDDSSSTDSSSSSSSGGHAPLGAFGEKEVVQMKPAGSAIAKATTVVEQFADGSPSIMRRSVGKNQTLRRKFYLVHFCIENDRFTKTGSGQL